MTQYTEVPPNTQPQKNCTKCGVSKPLSEFSVHRRSKDGHQCNCKTCNAQYYQENKERLIGYRQEHKKQIAAYHARYYQEHKEASLAHTKRYRQENKERYADYCARYYKENKDKIVAKVARYRARKAALPADWTAEDEQYAFDYFEGLCAVCGKPLNGFWHTGAMDHWIPLNADVENNPGTVPWNMVPLCHGEGGCNNIKKDKMPDVWLIEQYGKRKAKKIMKRIETFFEMARNI